VKEDIELKMKIDALTKKVDALVIGKSINAANPFHVRCCSICASAYGPFSETYNPGWRNHPNFSWKQNQPLNQGGALIKPIVNTPPDFINQFIIRVVQCSEHQHTKHPIKPLPLLHNPLWKTLSRPSCSSQANLSMT
jgi:hypothetical protein